MENPRVRLQFKNFSPGRGGKSWHLIDRKSCTTVGDFLSDIQQTYSIGPVPLICTLKGFVLPEWECIDIVRDDDELFIEEDQSKVGGSAERRYPDKDACSKIKKDHADHGSSKGFSKEKKKKKRKRASEGRLSDNQNVSGNEECSAKPPKRKKQLKEHEDLKAKKRPPKQHPTFKAKSSSKSRKTERTNICAPKMDDKDEQHMVIGNGKGNPVESNNFCNKTLVESDGQIGKTLYLTEKESIIRKPKKSKKEKNKEKLPSLNNLLEKDTDNMLKKDGPKLVLKKEKAEQVKNPEQFLKKCSSFEVTNSKVVSTTNYKSSSAASTQNHVFFHSDDDVDEDMHEYGDFSEHTGANVISPIAKFCHSNNISSENDDHSFQLKCVNKSKERNLKYPDGEEINSNLLEIDLDKMQSFTESTFNEVEPSKVSVQESTQKTARAAKLMENYDSFPELQGQPRVGDNIAFKVLELSMSYTPEISDYKEALVQDVDQRGKLTLLLSESSQQRKQGDGYFTGKFKLDSDEEDIDDVLEVNWQDLMEPKLLKAGNLSSA